MLEINKIENKTIIEKIKETKSRFFENINNIDKSLGRLTEKNERKSK